MRKNCSDKQNFNNRVHWVDPGVPTLPEAEQLIASPVFSVSSCCVLNIKEAFTTFGSATILHMYVYVHTTHCYYML
ncbi:hypothetical protein ACLKA7_000754 [Drosophila subpalustris]